MKNGYFQLSKDADRPRRSYLARRIAALANSLRKKIVFRRVKNLELDPESFDGQSVLIVGPARTLSEDLRSFDIDAFDYVVKMNNGLDTPLPMDTGDPLRCDILLHSFTQDARLVTLENLAKAGVRIIVHRTEYRRDYLNTVKVRAFLRQKSTAQVKFIPAARYDLISSEIEGKSPTTGLVCIDFFCRSGAARIGIVGLSFYRTNYIAGYDDRHDSDKRSREILSLSEHAPDLEVIHARRCVQDARNAGKDIILGQNVARFLNIAR